MRTTKKFLSMLLVAVMLLNLLPAVASASEEGTVYISVSYEGQFIHDKNGNPIAHIPVSFDALSEIDLDAYGLTDYKYDADGDGSYEITALHLMIYAHENLYGGSWSDVTFTGTPGSSYFQGGIFGFDENLNYYLNGQYPLAGEGWGATTENIVLEPGDCLDVASFSCWGFYSDPAFGFHYFADAAGDMTFAYTAETGSACSVKLIRGTKDENYNSQFFDEPDYPISWGKTLFTPEGTATTGNDGTTSVTFPEAGTYYLWCDGGRGTEGANEFGMGYHDYCDHYMANMEPCIVSAPAYAVVTVTAAEAPEPEEPAQPGQTDQAQDVSAVLNAAMAQLAATVTAPSFGTSAGEWTVLSLARGGYYAKDDAYFTDYYNRIVQTVNETAASVNMSGALHKNKSTENSRLIVALSAIGKDATAVGSWNLVEAYSENGISWIAKQGINGPTWALIALDSHNYATSDTTIRQQCVDRLLATQHDDGGWAGSLDVTYASDPDYTGMALQALYPYRDQEAVAAACEEAFACLSEMQLETGGFASDGAETAESAAQVIVACATWGINPDTDSRFVKNGNSVVDALLAHYLPESAQFQHSLGSGANDMATDQACYALIAYDRLLNGEPSLYDYSDVTFDDPAGDSENTPGDTEEGTGTLINATLGLPRQIENAAGTAFNGVISVDNWDNEAGYKLIDFLMTIPKGLKVTGVAAGSRLCGGEVVHNLDTEGNLRCAYFDSNSNTDLTITGEEFPAEVFTISFEITEEITAESLQIAINGMSVKLSSDSSDEDSMIILNTEPVTDPEGGTSGGGSGNVGVVTGISFSATELYIGDDKDLIPATRKAVAVAVTGITGNSTLVYKNGNENIQLHYSAEISSKTGVTTYLALVSTEIPTENFVEKTNFLINGTGFAQKDILFGDANGDKVVNAQDALAAVNAWLRVGEAPTDEQILVLNVNGDSRLNTFDALGIVEAFVSGNPFGVITRAAILAGK